jgi:dUTP pyrophosphatase
MPYTLNLLPVGPVAASFYTSFSRNDDNAGYDLFVPADVTFEAGQKMLVTMSVKAVMSKSSANEPTSTAQSVHYWMLPRSSLSKTGLMLCNSVGVIDKSYRGELMAYLWNTKDTPVTVKKGDRLVQIVAPDMGWISQVAVVESLDETARGDGGFGSSGA